MGNLVAAIEAAKNQNNPPPKEQTPSEATPKIKSNSTDSAKYLDAELPSLGQPTWSYWDGQGRYAHINGSDGKDYVFVPDDYVKKGLVSDGLQFYNKQYLDPATFKNAMQYTLPKGMQSVVNNNGYIWSADDAKKLGLESANAYKIDADNPAILGLGNPHPSMQVGAPISYITQPKLAPGGERVQQDWITAADGRQGGLGQYAYYRYQGPFADMARGALQSLGPLTPILLDVFAGPGAGAIYTMSKAAGEATYTGDWNKAATTIGTIMAAPYVSDAVSGALSSVIDLGSVANSIVGNAVGNATVAGLTGGDPVAALINSGVGGAVGAIAGKIDGFSDLPPSVQRVFNATVRAELTGRDPGKAAVLAATTAGLQAIKNGMDANQKIQNTYGRDATPEELNNFAYVQTPEEMNASFDKYMKDVEAQNSARQAAIDEQNRKDAEAAAAGYTTPESYDTYLTDKKAKEEADAKKIADDEVERLRQAGLKEQTDKEAAEAAARQAAIDEQNRLDAENKAKAEAEAKKIADDEAERLRLAGLKEKTDQEAAEAAAKQALIDEQNRKDAEAAARQAAIDEQTRLDAEAKEQAEQDKRVAEFGKDLTGGGNQDLGKVDTNTDFYNSDSTGMGAYKYDPTSGTYTYTSDDGSTLTLDADGNIVGSTEATDTSWTGLTDTATGNLNLPKLPSGKFPAVKPPAKKVTTTKPTTTTTGVGNTAITTGSNTAVQSGGGLNIPALLAIMGGFAGNEQPQQPQIQTYEPGKDFEYFDWESDPFAPQKPKTNPAGQPKMAGGGSIDELLEILKRSGI